MSGWVLSRFVSLTGIASLDIGRYIFLQCGPPVVSLDKIHCLLDAWVPVCWGVMVVPNNMLHCLFSCHDYLPSLLFPSSIDVLELVWVDPVFQYVFVLLVMFSSGLLHPHFFQKYYGVFVVSVSLIVVGSSG